VRSYRNDASIEARAAAWTHGRITSGDWTTDFTTHPDYTPEGTIQPPHMFFIVKKKIMISVSSVKCIQISLVYLLSICSCMYRSTSCRSQSPSSSSQQMPQHLELRLSLWSCRSQTHLAQKTNFRPIYRQGWSHRGVGGVTSRPWRASKTHFVAMTGDLVINLSLLQIDREEMT